MIGITEYAVADIFDYIRKHEERAFVLKFSAIEIYNEIIRDLLSSENTPLRLRDDPERGPIVEKLIEETLRDWMHLKELLSFCEAQRQVGETYLNDKSSRSHQIIRLTIESSAREFMGKSSSTTLAASLNFVDLAGSERASQALSAGSRLKEGCHINRSLLTLGTVIRKLSKGRHGHINYRDSKLTRILQPSLGGNSRTAIICTLSPARCHVEQTRNTLLFACCAKQVTTKAQVNVVMSDKVLVKQLQKEVARLESELRTPCPPSTNCDCASMLRKKNLRIEKMEREIQELIKQRDLAQSQVEDLLGMVGNNQKTKKERVDTWEYDDSISESSSIYPSDLRIREFNNSHYNNGNSESSPDKHPDEYCNEIQSVGLLESSKDGLEYPDPPVSDSGMLALTWYAEENVTSQEILTPVSEDAEERLNQDEATYDVLEQRLDDAQSSNGSPLSMSGSVSDCRNLKLTRSWSCREFYSTGSPGNVGEIVRTPGSSFEKCFHGRPDGLPRKFLPLTYGASTKLSMNGSTPSIGTPSTDELRTNSTRTFTNEDITSLQTFVSGMKEMVKIEYEKHLADDDQDKKAETTYFRFEKNMKDVGVDSMLEAPGSPMEWPLQFKQQQTEILELWEACNVSLFHRTYFFLLFRGDPTDSIYMEVERRRLCFLKGTFGGGNQWAKDAPTVALASSGKGVERERETLVKLMKRRLSEEEKRKLLRKWGIALDSKRRRRQLVNRIWRNTDTKHVMESAAVVAMLMRFTWQGDNGLNTTIPPLPPRSVALNPRQKIPCKLVSKTSISHDVRLFRFEMPSKNQLLGLPVGKHIFLCATIDGKLCMRAYTPTSSVEEVGFFDLLIKVYFKDVHPKFPNGGLMSQYLESLSIGSMLDVKGPLGHIEYTGRGNFTVNGKSRFAKRLAMLAGGTGITPIYQVAQAILKDPEDLTEMHVVYANRTEDDILLREELDTWAKEHCERFKVWYVVETAKEGWGYGVGFITEAIMREHLPEASSDSLAMTCGPPPMIQFAVQPNLEKMGYDIKNDLLVF